MNNEIILICSYCGNKTSHFVKTQISSQEEIYGSNGECLGKIDTYYYLTECKTCNGISLFSDWEGSGNTGDLRNASQLYPSSRELGKAIPEEIRKSYEEAKKVEKLSPNAFVVLLRRSLELLCRDQKAKGRNLKEQIADLSKMGLIPNTIVEMAETLRFIGNIGAHEIEVDIDQAEISAIDDFLVAMLEYVYVAPNKITKLKDSISKKSRK
ncbi:DUF4145 domain-containing protein [Candidatus Oleimmundimicrobium sp.]|uniref:DUF4145 domain-containing protein n=1 Tax=Candidatus Oleimmundimicrobium sp. TaxID=3060597 RepID=UPI00271926DA|nr:DUF4145 domain-containing protein [Candidatus Oleimmundimicrobium sp.]MDO8886181.1 DUF4145 domain-containing protein [Candidatus Oleimmundimicrobium sp.]